MVIRSQMRPIQLYGLLDPEVIRITARFVASSLIFTMREEAESI